MYTTCLKCGNKYKTYGKTPYVMSCYNCTEKFDNSTLKNIIKDFKLGKI